MKHYKLIYNSIAILLYLTTIISLNLFFTLPFELTIVSIVSKIILPFITYWSFIGFIITMKIREDISETF